MNRILPALLSFTLIAFTTGCRHTTYPSDPKYSIVPNFFDAKPGDQQLGPCHGGVVIDKAGNIHVTTDTKRGIVVFSPDGKFLRTNGPTRIHGLEIRKEKGVEYIYAARPSEHEVVKLTMNGERVWGISFPQESGLYEDAKGSIPVLSPSRRMARFSSPMVTVRTTCSSSTKTESS